MCEMDGKHGFGANVWIMSHVESCRFTIYFDKWLKCETHSEDEMQFWNIFNMYMSIHLGQDMLNMLNFS